MTLISMFPGHDFNAVPFELTRMPFRRPAQRNWLDENWDSTVSSIHSFEFAPILVSAGLIPKPEPIVRSAEWRQDSEGNWYWWVKPTTVAPIEAPRKQIPFMEMDFRTTTEIQRDHDDAVANPDLCKSGGCIIHPVDLMTTSLPLWMKELGF